MNKIVLFGVLFPLLLFTILSCGKTDEDKEREDILVGSWYTTEITYSYQVDSIFFIFETGNDGKSIVGPEEDEFSWEIVRGTLKTYYQRAPDYNIGFDKYNSKGVYAIKSFENDVVKLEQHFNNGIYSTFSIYRY